MLNRDLQQRYYCNLSFQCRIWMPNRADKSDRRRFHGQDHVNRATRIPYRQADRLPRGVSSLLLNISAVAYISPSALTVALRVSLRR